MKNNIDASREHFIQGMSRIANFWGLPKAVGAIYGAIYLSPEPLTLDTLVDQVGITKGAISTNVRSLERLGMILKHYKVGDRKDYYTAEEDFWKIVKGILKEREKNEFNLAIKTVAESLEMVKKLNTDSTDSEIAEFYKNRMNNIKNFFDVLDNFVATALAIDELRSSTVKKLFGKK